MILGGIETMTVEENQFTIIKKLDIQQVLDICEREKRKTRIKKMANLSLNWYEVKIPSNIIKNVFLPHHPRCQLSFIPRMCTHLFNNLELVPKHGATVEDTCQLLKRIEKRYSQKRSKCFETIKNYDGKNIGHIVLSQVPIRSFPRHKKIRMREPGLISIDGFHRLVSLFYPKKINFDYVICCLASFDKI